MSDVQLVLVLCVVASTGMYFLNRHRAKKYPSGSELRAKLRKARHSSEANLLKYERAVKAPERASLAMKFAIGFLMILALTYVRSVLP